MNTYGYFNGIQKYLNAIRKTEIRTRKLEEEKTEVDEKWALFQQGLKDAFIKERGRHKERTSKIQASLEEQLLLKEATIQDLQDHLNNPKKSRKSMVNPEEDDAVADFEELLARPGPREHGLAAALSGAMRGGDLSREEDRQNLLATLREHIGAREAPNHAPKKGADLCGLHPPTRASASRRADSAEAGESADAEMEAKDDPYQSSPALKGMMPEAPRIRTRSRSSSRTPVKLLGRMPSQTPRRSRSPRSSMLFARQRARR